MSQFAQGPHDPVLRPRDLGQVLDQTFKVYFRYFKPLFMVGLLATIPSILAFLFFFALMAGGDIESSWMFTMISAMEEGDFSGLAAFLSLMALLGLAFLLLVPIYQGAVIDAATRAVLHMEPVPLTESLRVGLRKYWPLLGTAVLQFIIMGLTVLISPFVGLLIFALLTVPFGMAVVYTCIMFANHAIIVEGRGGGLAALGRSFELAKSRFWPLVGFVVVFHLLVYIVQTMVTMPVSFGVTFATIASESMGSFSLVYLFQGLVSALVLPFLVVGKTVIYFDTRVRREAYDLEVMAQQQAQQQAQQGPSPMAPPPEPPL